MVARKARNPIRLTRATVEALKPESGAYFLPTVNAKGQAIQGLNIRVLPSGLKVFVHRYRFHGLQKVYKLGQFPAMTPDAAEKASRRAQSDVDAGRDPGEAKAIARKAAAEARKAAVTLHDLADRFIAEHLCAEVTWEDGSFTLQMLLDRTAKPLGNNKESTAREYVRLIHRDILPALGKTPLKDMDTSMVAAFLFKIRKERPTHSNRVRAVLSKMFNKAELWGMRPLGSNPVRGQDRAQERKKERNLSDQEIYAVGAILRAVASTQAKPYFHRGEGELKPESPHALAALRLILLTGMRKSEIVGDRYRGIPALTWPDVDLEAGVLRIHHKTESHTGKKRTVYLCKAAQALLKHTKENLAMLGNPHVACGKTTGEALVNLHAVWDRIRDIATEDARKAGKHGGRLAPGIDISDVTIHDLRRTFSSVGARLGYPELWIGALLGHSANTVTQGYARVNADPLREAVEAIGGRIAGLLDGSIDPMKEAEERREGKERNLQPNPLGA